MELLFFIGLFIIIAIILAARHSRRTDETWRQFALQEGLAFKPAGFAGQRKLSGTFAGFSVLVETYRKRSGKHSSTRTRYRVHYPPLGLGLALTAQGLFSGVARFLGSQDIETGDAEFDALVTIKGNDPQAVSEFLGAARRAGIHAFFKDHTGGRIEDARISFQTRGAETDAQRLQSRLEKACSLASLLCAGDGFEPMSGHAPRSVENEEDVGARVPAAGARPVFAPVEQADEVLEEVPELLPPDMTRMGDTDEARGTEIPEMTPPAESAALPSSEPGTAASPAPSAAGPSVEALCHTLFSERLMSFEVGRLFDEHFAGAEVSWSGTLERLDRYFSDPVFGKGPGVRAVIEIGNVSLDSYGSRPVKAIVQLPEDARDTLGSLRGETLRFSGRLVRCEAFMHHVFLADGTVSS